MRSHATAEVLGRNDDRNPRYYYGTGKVTPKRDFWSTREGKAVKRNWSALQGELIDAFNTRPTSSSRSSTRCSSSARSSRPSS